ncbi:hypothetical protein [Nonomuraea rubra]|uniref:hypothetical protein n=1 Tax=Nonomuraea rubra TaxID=46180 RepID=UPI0033F7728D
MAQIEVEAAAHVLGMHVGERGRFEDTPFLRGAIEHGYLRLSADKLGPQVLESAERDDTAADESFEAAEAIARARHPAGKRRAAAAAAEGAAEGEVT